MANQRVEIQHNEAGQIREWLDDGLLMMSERGIDPIACPEVLVKLVELLAAKTIQEVRFVPPDLIAAPAGSFPGGRQGH